MKVPFYTIIGPLIRKHRRNARHICALPLFCYSSHYYTPLLGICGVLLSVLDLYRIIRCGSILPAYLMKDRKSAGVVSPELERDLKLLSLVLSLEYYLLVLLGFYAHNPVLFLPFLFLYAFIAFVEFVNLVLRVLSRTINITKTGLLISAFVAFNWISVFCTFYQMTGRCDL